MTLLACITLASWFLVIWDALSRADHTARPGLALVAITSSVSLAVATLL